MTAASYAEAERHAFQSFDTDAVNTVANATGRTWSVQYTPSFTPSLLVIDVDGDFAYTAVASGAETALVRVLVAGGEVFRKNLIHLNVTAGSSRSSVLVPLICAFNNTDKDAKTIDVIFEITAGNDSIIEAAIASRYITVQECAQQA